LEILELDKDPESLGFFTAVNVRSGRAKNVPVPTQGNFKKIANHYAELPENIRAKIESSMPQGVPKGMRTLIDELSKQKALGRES